MQGINENPNHDHVKLEIPILNTIKIREVDLISVKSVPRDKLFLKTKTGSKRHLEGGCRVGTRHTDRSSPPALPAPSCETPSAEHNTFSGNRTCSSTLPLFCRKSEYLTSLKSQSPVIGSFTIAEYIIHITYISPGGFRMALTSGKLVLHDKCFT